MVSATCSQKKCTLNERPGILNRVIVQMYGRHDCTLFVIINVVFFDTRVPRFGLNMTIVFGFGVSLYVGTLCI